jgi:hypothetical protein
MRIPVKSLRPNPFRNIDRYPISRDKVDALKRSITDTTFWDNLLVREAPNGKGYEITFGHHRKIALEELIRDNPKYPKSIEAQVRDLTDTQMARMMAHENMQEWESSATVEQETIRAIVEGYANGKIELDDPNGVTKGRLRYAPRFSIGEHQDARPDAPYTIETLARFLGWGESKVYKALSGLSAVEEDVAEDVDFHGLSPTAADEVAIAARRIAKETGSKAKAKKVVKQVAEDIRAGTVSTRGIKFAAEAKAGLIDYRGKIRPLRRLPDIDQFAVGIAGDIDRLFFDRQDEFAEIVEHQASLRRESRAMLMAALKRAVDVHTSLNVVVPIQGHKQLA